MTTNKDKELVKNKILDKLNGDVDKLNYIYEHSNNLFGFKEELKHKFYLTFIDGTRDIEDFFTSTEKKNQKVSIAKNDLEQLDYQGKKEYILHLIDDEDKELTMYKELLLGSYKDILTILNEENESTNVKDIKPSLPIDEIKRNSRERIEKNSEKNL